MAKRVVIEKSHPRLGVCDRDITTLSAHALIGHCLGNSHVTCQNYRFIVETEVVIGRSQPEPRSGEGCDQADHGRPVEAMKVSGRLVS